MSKTDFKPAAEIIDTHGVASNRASELSKVRDAIDTFIDNTPNEGRSDPEFIQMKKAGDLAWKMQQNAIKVRDQCSNAVDFMKAIEQYIKNGGISTDVYILHLVSEVRVKLNNEGAVDE